MSLRLSHRDQQSRPNLTMNLHVALRIDLHNLSASLPTSYEIALLHLNGQKYDFFSPVRESSAGCDGLLFSDGVHYCSTFTPLNVHVFRTDSAHKVRARK